MSFPLTFDDAAVFPPGNLPLAEAVAAHRVHRQAPYAHLLGPMVVAHGHLDELASLVGEGLLGVAVVATGADAAVAATRQVAETDGLQLVALEVKEATPAELETTVGEVEGVDVHLELPRGERCHRVVAALSGTPYRAKVRTGGVEASMHPDEAELAATVVALARAGVPFKATAGLHHALRNTDPRTGFEQHGFLNLLVATEAACEGAEVDEVARLLAERDHAHLPRLPERSLFTSVGTCSITEPVDDLTALGHLGRGQAGTFSTVVARR